VIETLVAGLAVAIAVGLAAPIVLVLRRVSRQAFERDEAMRANWQALAQANQLIFVPGRYRAWGKSETAYLAGRYQGRELRLDSLEQVKSVAGRGETRYVCTRLTLPIQVGDEALATHPGVGALAGREQAAADQPAEASTPTPLTDQPAEASTPTPLAGQPAEASTPTLTEASTETIDPLIYPDRLSSLKGAVSLQGNASQLYYEQPRLETDIDYLRELLTTLCATADGYVHILALGGEAVPKLQAVSGENRPERRAAALQLIQGIAQQTGQQLGHRFARLLCPDCLAHYAPHKVALPEWQTVTYYGCRRCGQSRRFWQGQVVARLDRGMRQDWRVQENLIEINWLARRRLFDFDAVTIAQAGDEAVERFAVQVGNDTDPYRRPRYPHMRCRVAVEAGLSENTLRILQRAFGQVEIVPNLSLEG
jgi:RNase P subunit RPR2